MSAGALFVGVDVGTQGTKALVYEQQTGKVVSRGAKPYDVLKTNVPGRAEQHPSLWIEVRANLDPAFNNPSVVPVAPFT